MTNSSQGQLVTQPTRRTVMSSHCISEFVIRATSLNNFKLLLEQTDPVVSCYAVKARDWLCFKIGFKLLVSLYIDMCNVENYDIRMY